jgi:hypothetical protein
MKEKIIARGINSTVSGPLLRLPFQIPQAEWFLGHSKSPQWKTKPETKRRFILPNVFNI